MNPGIMVCITLIFEALEHVVLNPSFHDVFLEIMLFALFKPGRVTQCPSKLISLYDELLLGGSLKSHRPSLPYLPLSIFIHSISPFFLGIGIGYTRRGCTLPRGKKGLKAQRVKVVGKS